MSLTRIFFTLFFATVFLISWTVSFAAPSVIELVCTDDHGRTRLLRAEAASEMILLDPARPQMVEWLEKARLSSPGLVMYENHSWIIIYDRDRNIGSLQHLSLGEFFLCEGKVTLDPAKGLA